MSRCVCVCVLAPVKSAQGRSMTETTAEYQRMSSPLKADRYPPTPTSLPPTHLPRSPVLFRCAQHRRSRTISGRTKVQESCPSFEPIKRQILTLKHIFISSDANAFSPVFYSGVFLNLSGSTRRSRSAVLAAGPPEGEPPGRVL